MSDKKRPEILLSIIVPTYQEADNIEPLTKLITASMKEYVGRYEIILVDDNSQDGTIEIVDGLEQEGLPIKLITRTDERGLSSAVIRGFKEAKGEILLCMDADMSHPTEAIPRMIKSFQQEPETDFVLGSRYVPGGSTAEDWGFSRWLNSKAATTMAMPLVKVKDPMSGFFSLPKIVFQRADRLNPVGYKIALELMIKCRCEKICEVPIYFAQRKYGQSKLSLNEQLNYIRHIKRLMEYKFGLYFSFVLFCAIGGTGLVVDMLSYWLLLKTNSHLTVSRAVAILVAMTWNFWLNRRITFSYSRAGNILKQYFGFVISCSVGAVVNWLISVKLVLNAVSFQSHPLLAALLGILAGTIFNFFLSKYLVFRKRKSTDKNSRFKKSQLGV